MGRLQLTIIIPTTKDRDAIFRTTLAHAIKAIEGLEAEVLVINDSADYIPDVSLQDANVKILNNPGKGVVSARNYGAQVATGELLLFLDNDILISAHSVNYFVNLHKGLANACVNPNWIYPVELNNTLRQTNFGKYLEDHHMTTLKGWYGDNTSWKDNALFTASGVASFHLTISKANFNKSGGYSTALSYGSEDHDLPHRLKAAGLHLYIDSRITVFHNEADRLNLTSRLKSLEVKFKSRQMAVKLGYSELELHYGVVKKILLPVIYFFRKPIISFLELLPQKRFGYIIFCKLTGMLEAAVIFKGYMYKASLPISSK